MSSLQWWSVIDVALFIGGLAVFLFILGSQLKKVGSNLEESADLVWQIKKDADNVVKMTIAKALKDSVND